MGFSRREEKEEQEYLFKKGGSVLIKGIWDYNGMLILYGKVSEGLITNRMSFLLPRTNGKTMRAYPETLQGIEPRVLAYLYARGIGSFFCYQRLLPHADMFTIYMSLSPVSP